MHDQLKKRIRWQQKELQKIIYAWELIPGAPADEFDSLADKILGHLYKSASYNTLTRVLESELIEHYGLFPVSKEAIESMAREVMTWWQSQ